MKRRKEIECFEGLKEVEKLFVVWCVLRM